MSKSKIYPNSKLSFLGCSGCGATCCQSNLIYASLYDFDKVTKYFPMFFMIKNSKISLVYFFYYGEGYEQHCPYLKDNLCTIYQQRPYACRTYPFNNNKNDFYYSNTCPHITQDSNNIGMQLSDSKSINKSIIDDFITEDFLDYQDHITKISEDFVKFCNKNDLLIPYKEHYKTKNIYMNFKPSMQKDLYVIHPFKLAALRLNGKQLFNGKEYYLSIIQQLIKAQSNIEKLAKLRD